MTAQVAERGEEKKRRRTEVKHDLRRRDRLKRGEDESDGRIRVARSIGSLVEDLVRLRKLVERRRNVSSLENAAVFCPLVARRRIVEGIDARRREDGGGGTVRLCLTAGEGDARGRIG
jgi:hypothetical protein